jgi:uncharacterized protein (TIGR00304 family)
MTDYGSRVMKVGFLLTVIGAMAIMASAVLSSLSSPNGGSASFGGVIVIGPIPVVFGTDRTAVLIAVIGAVILMIVVLATMIANSRRIRRLVDMA